MSKGTRKEGKKMKIRRFSDHPCAQATIIEYSNGAKTLVSYSTPVVYIDEEGWLRVNGLYSMTTIKHIGWFMREQTVTSDDGTFRTYHLCGHEGTDDGFRASFWICPELDMVTVVLSNLSGAPVKRISKKLFDRITR